MKILECSSAGDKRFSAFYARVSVWGKEDTIEKHYQNSKRTIDGDIPKKGQKVDYMVLGGMKLDVKYLTPFYKIMWVKYLDSKPSLVKYASQFDEFSDQFKGKSINCQADVIRDYVKYGRDSIMLDPLVEEFFDLITK